MFTRTLTALHGWRQMRVDFVWGSTDTTIKWHIGESEIGSITLGRPMASLAAVLPGMRKFDVNNLPPMWWGDIRFYDNGAAPSSTEAATEPITSSPGGTPQFAGAPRQAGTYLLNNDCGGYLLIFICSEFC